MEIKLSHGLVLSPHLMSDADQMTVFMQVKEISDQTLRIPYPYTRKNAEQFLAKVIAERAQHPRDANLAIRLPDGRAIGGIGFHNIELQLALRAEIGYWLAQPYWGKGIMTEAVKAMCEYGHREWGFIRIEAGRYENNPASGRVLEKAGFVFEGLARALYVKNGVPVNSVRYARVQLK